MALGDLFPVVNPINIINKEKMSGKTLIIMGWGTKTWNSWGVGGSTVGLLISGHPGLGTTMLRNWSPRAHDWQSNPQTPQDTHPIRLFPCLGYTHFISPGGSGRAQFLEHVMLPDGSMLSPLNADPTEWALIMGKE